MLAAECSHMLVFGLSSGDLGLILDKTVKLEWHRTNNTRTRCLRITQKVRLVMS